MDDLDDTDDDIDDDIDDDVSTYSGTSHLHLDAKLSDMCSIRSNDTDQRYIGKRMLDESADSNAKNEEDYVVVLSECEKQVFDYGALKRRARSLFARKMGRMPKHDELVNCERFVLRDCNDVSSGIIRDIPDDIFEKLSDFLDSLVSSQCKVVYSN